MWVFCLSWAIHILLSQAPGSRSYRLELNCATGSAGSAAHKEQIGGLLGLHNYMSQFPRQVSLSIYPIGPDSLKTLKNPELFALEHPVTAEAK